MRRALQAVRQLGTPGIVGLVMLVVIVLACLIGPLLSPYGINEPDLRGAQPGPELGPSVRHGVARRGPC